MNWIRFGEEQWADALAVFVAGAVNVAGPYVPYLAFDPAIVDQSLNHDLPIQEKKGNCRE